MKTSELKMEKKEIRQSAEKEEKNNDHNRLSLPTIPENSLIS